jgi:hypothetical protein
MKKNHSHTKSTKLYDGITDIRDDLIDHAKPHWKHKKKTWRFTAAAAVFAAAAALAAALFPFGNPASTSAHMIQKADYPQSAPYPDEAAYTDKNGNIKDSFDDAYDAWWEDTSKRRQLANGYADSMDGFLSKSIQQFLSASPGENIAYSPLNLYLALGMLAELTASSFLIFWTVKT